MTDTTQATQGVVVFEGSDRKELRRQVEEALGSEGSAEQAEALLSAVYDRRTYHHGTLRLALTDAEWEAEVARLAAEAR